MKDIQKRERGGRGAGGGGEKGEEKRRRGMRKELEIFLMFLKGVLVRQATSKFHLLVRHQLIIILIKIDTFSINVNTIDVNFAHQFSTISFPSVIHEESRRTLGQTCTSVHQCGRTT